MTVGVVQLYNQWGDIVAGTASNQWDSATATHYAWLLAKSSYTPLDTHTQVSDLGTAGVDWISSGDGAPISAGGTGRTVDNFNGATQFKTSADANFGSAVTVSAKYLICVAGDYTSIQSTDKLIFWQNLKTEGGEASSSASDFNVQRPANGIWWQVNVQA